MEKHEKWNSKTIDMIVMIGLPGSGKSYTAEKTCKAYEEVGKPIEIISRDQIRIDLGFCGSDEKFAGTKSQEDKVSSIVTKRIKSCVERGVNFIIDNTSLKKKYRDAFKELVKNNNVRVIYHYIEADSIETNIERRKGQIDARVIRNMLSSLEFPSKSECDYLLIN